MPKINSTILDKVKDPFTLLVLILLMVESVLGGMAYAFSDFRRPLIYSIIIFFALYTIPVLYLVIRERTLTPSAFAKDLGNDIYAALHGPFSNLEEVESEEAWATLAEVIRNSGSQESEQSQLFRNIIADRLEKNAQIQGNWKPLQNHQIGN